MIRFTNYDNIDPIFYAVLTNRDRLYSGNKSDSEFSCTELLKPVKESILFKRIKNDPDRVLEIDVMENFWALFGSIVHYIFEIYADLPELKKVLMPEKRFEIDIAGTKVSGGIDLYNKETGELLDYKYTSVWNAIRPTKVPDWTLQLNLYRIMLQRAGFEVNRIIVRMIFKDWSASMRNIENYPEKKFKEIEIPVLPDSEVLSYFSNKIAEIRKFENTQDDNIPICSETERWLGESKLSVVSGGGKVFKYFKYKTEEEKAVAKRNCEEFLMSKNFKDATIQDQRGEEKKCLEYCTVRSICNYGRILIPEL